MYFNSKQLKLPWSKKLLVDYLVEDVVAVHHHGDFSSLPGPSLVVCTKRGKVED